MSRGSTFGKVQRERDKRAKAQAKRERRIAGPDENEATEPTPEPLAPRDEQRVLEELATLHARYDNGEISMEDFEARRDELREQLTV